MGNVTPLSSESFRSPSFQGTPQQSPVVTTPNQTMFGTPAGKLKPISWSSSPFPHPRDHQQLQDSDDKISSVLLSSSSVPMLNRPTPDARAFVRPQQLKRKYPVSARKQRVLGQAKLRPSPSFRCPPTPIRSAPREKRNTPGSQHKNDESLGEAKVLFNSPFRKIPLKDSDRFSFLSSPELLPSLAYLDVLGEGSSSVVYRVRNNLDGKLYAVKKYRSPFISLKDREKALGEASMWVQVANCPYIVPLYRAWQEDGHLHLMMHLCEGGSLKEYGESITLSSYVMNSQQETHEPYTIPRSDQVAIDCENKSSHYLEGIRSNQSIQNRKQQLDGNPAPENSSVANTKSEAEIWRCLYDCCNSLAFIHEQLFVHNDVKPSNFYLGIVSDTEGYRILLGDFGQMSKRGQLQDGDEGDFVYMAQEVLDGASEPSTDMFALGLSFYEIAADVELPENGEMWHSLRKGQIPPFTNGRSNDLYTLLCKMLDPIPENRPTATQVMNHPRVQQARKVKLEIYPASQPYFDATINVVHNCETVRDHSQEFGEEEDTDSVGVSPAQKSAKGDFRFFESPLEPSLSSNAGLHNNDLELSRQDSISSVTDTTAARPALSPRRRLYADFDRLEEIEGALAAAQVACPSEQPSTTRS